MKINTLLTAATTVLTVGLGAIAPAQADSFYAGTASNGQSVRVDTDSINRASSRSVNFIYYLGEERIFAQAHCDTRGWTTFPENQTQYPQSLATQRMVDFVCDKTVRNVSTTARTALVVDPPSNVRVTPNGRIICSLERTQIQVFEATGSWYRTNVCGSKGYIHKSQIQF